MKIITGNRLSDGRVVYFSAAGQWSVDMGSAQRLHDGETETVLAAAQSLVHEIADAYLMDADPVNPSDNAPKDDMVSQIKPAGRTHIRETIRAAGPTVRPDLGRQAKNP
ncbi:MAG: DUF2849 domain-containing protein [Pseudomonadota bacterium]